MTADALALFDTPEASPPRTGHECPACGGPNARRHPRDPRCERCARAGIEAPSLLGLGAGTITTPGTLAARSPVRCIGCGLEGAALAMLGARSIGTGDQLGALCRTCEAGGVAAAELAAEQAPELTPREAHRARCNGVMMAPIFGMGRTSCGLCDWSPTD